MLGIMRERKRPERRNLTLPMNRVSRSFRRHITMLFLPENRDYTVRGLAAICKDGVDGITAQLREPAPGGYPVRRVVRNGSGRIRDTEYVIYEEPRLPSP